MPLPDTISTFTYYLTQVASMKPAYIQLQRFVEILDVPAKPTAKQLDQKARDKPWLRAIPHDVIAVYGAFIKPPTSALVDHMEELIRGPAMPKPEFDSKNPTPTRLLVNGGLTGEQAEELLGQGVIDAAVFGQLWIGNPDLQKRFEKGVPVNTALDYSTLYGGVDGDIGVGYTTYPTATEL